MVPRNINTEYLILILRVVRIAVCCVVLLYCCVVSIIIPGTRSLILNSRCTRVTAVLHLANVRITYFVPEVDLRGAESRGYRTD